MSDRFNPTSTDTVKKIVRTRQNIFLYIKITGHWHHHVKVTPEQAQDIQIGDRIEHTPFSSSASWFVGKVS